MKGFLIWFFGTVGAFLVTAGAFLLLANLGSNASERSLESSPPSSGARLPLELNMNRDELESLEALAGQELTLVVENGSSNSFSEVSLTLRVSSEDTTLADSRYYQAKVNELEAGESERATFPLDLSPLADPREEGAYGSGSRGRSRIVLEVQATTPEGISAVKTAVLPFSDDGST
ncbi:hypothetical protein BH24ACT21_BH24ACT21_00350 [soil metagenome]|jgi:hypothetical protein